ncbi:ArdC family protein [Phyllobacterium sophorae]|uniref:Antirestriction protein ArdC n=1 Tax=Phyllobacterium sophorae TaxID=1520277 RepID=A0A2P7B313_9HYPH|nr:zincin-like metallopeptidase domain-containing protein [Phyllobacterium sophorae]PSH60838.1 antirestriction protein ArdC [Phyllobacterium sophorae]
MTATAKTPRRDLYQEITDKLIVELEKGVFPWARPWKSVAETPEAQSLASFSMPRNARSQRLYSGINTLLLWIAKDEGAYKSNRWLTFNQAKQLGGCVRKGERGTLVVYADRFIPKEERQAAKKENRDANPVFFLKGFTVFNLDQCNELPEEAFVTVAPESATVPERSAAIIAAAKIDLRIGGDTAYYTQQGDFIAMPHPSQFPDRLDFDRTFFHEAVHWAGATSRLDRDLSRYHSDNSERAREELCAELGASFVAAAMGIEPTVRHASYLKSWLTVLKADKRAIFQAARLASQSADYLLAFETNAEPQSEEAKDLTEAA